MPSRAAIAAACALAGALAVGVGLRGGSESAPAPASATAARFEAEIERLRQRVEAEAASRAALADEVSELRAALAALEAKAQPAPTPETAAQGTAEVGEDEISVPSPLAAAAATGAGLFDPAALLAAGFSESEVEALRVRLDEFQMEQLYLRDRASREGWLGTPRFREEVLALQVARQGVREEFGEELYDWMLYASGSPNRVAVIGLLEGSPAGAAGVRPGDVVLRYADRAIRDPLELRQATAAGRAGESVAIELERDGGTVRLYVPRGPLGARLEARSVEPPAR